MRSTCCSRRARTKQSKRRTEKPPPISHANADTRIWPRSCHEIVRAPAICRGPPCKGEDSRLAPFAGFYVELHFSCSSHAEQQLLQGVGALAAGVEQVLERSDGAGLVQRSQHVFFSCHD